jgi:hypothetical protein
MTAAMTRIAALAAVLLGLVTTTATADEQHACLSKAEQRAAIANGQAVTLAAPFIPRAARCAAVAPGRWSRPGFAASQTASSMC